MLLSIKYDKNNIIFSPTLMVKFKLRKEQFIKKHLSLKQKQTPKKRSNKPNAISKSFIYNIIIQPNFNCAKHCLQHIRLQLLQPKRPAYHELQLISGPEQQLRPRAQFPFRRHIELSPQKVLFFFQLHAHPANPSPLQASVQKLQAPDRFMLVRLQKLADCVRRGL